MQNTNNININISPLNFSKNHIGIVQLVWTSLPFLFGLFHTFIPEFFDNLKKRGSIEMLGLGHLVEFLWNFVRTCLRS